jgi:hypothetical protein
MPSLTRKLEEGHVGAGKTSFIEKEASDRDKGGKDKDKDTGGKSRSPAVMRTQVTDVVYTDNIIFESDNEWGIPTLRADRMFEFPADSTVGLWAGGAPRVYADFHVYVAGSSRSNILPPRAFLIYYTHDYLFEDTWQETPTLTRKLVDEQWAGVMTPDYSVFWHDPFAVRMWQVYRSRWVGRYMQEAGLMVAPTIPYVGIGPHELGLSVAGIPKDLPLLGFELHTIRRTHQGEAYENCLTIFRHALTTLTPKKVFLYGIRPKFLKIAEELGVPAMEIPSSVDTRASELRALRGRVQSLLAPTRFEWSGSQQMRLW